MRISLNVKRTISLFLIAGLISSSFAALPDSQNWKDTGIRVDDGIVYGDVNNVTVNSGIVILWLSIPDNSLKIRHISHISVDCNMKRYMTLETINVDSNGLEIGSSLFPHGDSWLSFQLNSVGFSVKEMICGKF